MNGQMNSCLGQHHGSAFDSDSTPFQVIASVYGPISYPPLPLLVFRQTEGGSLELVASGEQLDGCICCL